MKTITITPQKIFPKKKKDGSFIQGINNKTGKEWKIFTILDENGKYYSIFHNSHETKPSITIGEEQTFEVVKDDGQYDPTIRKVYPKQKVEQTSSKILMETVTDLAEKQETIIKTVNSRRERIEKIETAIGNIELRLDDLEGKPEKEEKTDEDGYAIQ